MNKSKPAIDKVRASRDGHEYHETWTARAALQLLRPGIDLKAIAVEGLSPVDQRHASAEAAEIADLTFYYGQTAFPSAKQITITQFKYSIADENTHFRASHARKTIEKFADAYRDYKKRYGAKSVTDKLTFDLITNRPIYKPLQQAIKALAQQLPQTGEVLKQSRQFASAAGLTGKSLVEFAAKIRFIGISGDLSATNNELANLIVDWSATGDTVATSRLGQLRKMVRDKAGHAGTNRNLIVRTDILSALHIADADDLLPSKSSIPEVGQVIEREQLAATVTMVPRLSMPLLIHAAGGVGKTVFMDSLASIIGRHNEVVFFDCFGGGAYRSPEDARHQPKKGLIHIANTLSFRGLCDPILPDSTDDESLLKTFRRRLVQCTNALNQAQHGKELVLFIDAIDNAELVARSRNEDAFPIRILESLHHKAIPGVKLIVSCRTERKPSTYARYQELELLPFSVRETTAYLGTRLKKVSATEINVAQARSGGNPRVLDYLIKTGRSLLDESEIDKKLALDDLLSQRIADALATAIERGYKQDDVNAFLAGLAVLPPPVPLDEYAGAHGMRLSEIESFASDLRPLLERTNQGLMFRDEPTETLIRNNYASSVEALQHVSKNLLARQDTSVYAARALPGLLHQLDDGEQLFKLAFDERIPQNITSTVGKRNIRYARIKAAVLHAAIKQDRNRLVHLLLELSTLAAVDQRGAKYLHDNPDLVVVADDPDAMRRLFETRSTWPGARHARLVIANALSGDAGEAYRHAIAVDEWVHHYRRTEPEDRMNRANPDIPDIAAIPFLLACEGRAGHAARFLQGWRAWYAFEVGANIFSYLQLAASTQRVPLNKLADFIHSLKDIGSLAAALAFHQASKSDRKYLLAKLSKLCKKAKQLEVNESYQRKRSNLLQDGLRKASALALSLNMAKESLAISRCIPYSPPSLWSLREQSYHFEIFPFVFRNALEAAAAKHPVHERHLLPKELAQICASIKKDVIGESFRSAAKTEIEKALRNSRADTSDQHDPNQLSPDDKRNAERFIDQQLGPLLRLATALSDFLAAPARSADKAFLNILQAWEDARGRPDIYRTSKFDPLFSRLGFDIAIFAIWTSDKPKAASIKRFLKVAHAQDISAHLLIKVISIIAQRRELHVLAGEQALKAKQLIEAEDDVIQRASLFAELARAMLPASANDASSYFHDGLEQMDAIGSGDYEFTNELLLFASNIKGGELEECDFHTLSNICELNLGEEPHKFFWGAYARGMSKASGVRGLAKLCRFEDRGKIELEYTLLPYLTALLDDGKLEPDLALVIKGLANPIEYSEDGTKVFAEALQRHAGTRLDLIAELIKQFEDDNPGTPMGSTVGALASMAKNSFGETSETTLYLSAAQKHFEKVREVSNDHMNYHGAKNEPPISRSKSGDAEKRASLARIAKATDPTDRNSLADAINGLNGFQFIWDLKDAFFVSLRKKVPLKSRAQYIKDIASMENFSFYWKLAELSACKDSWKASSASLSQVFKNLAFPLVRQHADDLISHGRFSGYKLKEISDLTGVETGDLILELIKASARPETTVPGAVWLAFGSFVAPGTDDGQSQLALKRLLGSDAAKLANNVTDGAWQDGLYPESDTSEITWGLIWFMLGSPYAANRWRAAHSIRTLAKFGRWDVITLLVKNINATSAAALQACELKFGFLNARLWLLIALARVAIDYPKEVAEYKDVLLRFALDDKHPHVLMRHFSSRALLACADTGHLVLSADEESSVRTANSSPHPRRNEKIRKGGSYYQGRPKSVPVPAFDFHLDHDFHKNDVDNLGQVFGKPCWEVHDMISGVVHGLDAEAVGMYENDGRSPPNRRNSYGMSTNYHSYGQHLGWHALFFTAGRLLKDFPVTADWWYEEDPWGEWLGRYLLTRKDGYWLSDGTDSPPLDTSTILLEKAKDGLVLTGDQEKLLHIVGINKRIGKQLSIEGRWYSADGIEVHISSALAPTQKAVKLARRLTREVPMIVWLPSYDENESDDEYLRAKKNDYIPWVVVSSGEAKLDEHDPFGVPQANLRPYLAREFASKLSLVRNDRFGRAWSNERGAVLHAEAWGREDKFSDRGPHPGRRLICATSAIKELLKKNDAELLLLISLQRYEKDGRHRDSKYTHTIAVVRIDCALNFELHPGAINKLHVMKF